MASKAKRVVIVGGGFAGVWAALGAAATRQFNDAEQEIDITVIAPGQELLIRPRLYEYDLRGTRVALHTLLPQIRVRHVEAVVDKIFPDVQQVLALSVRAEQRISYDQLILCSGSRRGVKLSGPYQHGVDNFEEATALHAAMLAKRERRPTVGVIGAGFVGIEVATELASLADVHLVEKGSRVAPEYGPAGRAVIEEALAKLNIAVHLNTTMKLDEEGRAILPDGRELSTDLVVWATGPHAGNVGTALGIEHDEFGRVPVDETLSTTVGGVWAAGDCARAVVDGKHLSTMSCQHAMPMGSHAGANAVRTALGLETEPFRQPLYLTCLDLGAAGALLTSGFDRNQVLGKGESAKQFKRYINRHVIYPPSSDTDALLKLGAATTPSPAAAATQIAALRSKLVRRAITSSAHDRASDHLTTWGRARP